MTMIHQHIGRSLLLVVVLALSTLFTARLPLQAAPAPSALLDTLALIPDTPDSRPTNYFGARFVDLRAIELAGGFKRPASFSMMNSSARTQWLNAMIRARALGLDDWADALTGQIDRNVDMPRLVGFDWFAIDHMIGYGAPPRVGLALTGTFDAAKIGKALSSRGFQQSDVTGTTVWYRFEDGQEDPKAREPRDPFGGATGAAARIAILPGYLGSARYWDMAKQLVATSRKEQKSLADAADYRSLADAVTDPDVYQGSLLQAVFIPGSIFDRADIFGVRLLPDLPDPTNYGELPPYTLAVLADRQEGNMQVHLVAVAYPDVATAQRASAELYKRIAGFDIAQMYERYAVTIDQPHIYNDASGLSVLVVSVRYALPSKPDPSTGPTPLPGILYNRWLSMVYFYPLAPKIPNQ
jgi:hypothetical protein